MKGLTRGLVMMNTLSLIVSLSSELGYITGIDRIEPDAPLVVLYEHMRRDAHKARHHSEREIDERGYDDEYDE